VINIGSRMIRALRLCPSSDFILQAAFECDDDGFISEDSRFINHLDNIIKHGKELDSLFHSLSNDWNQLRNVPSEHQYIRLKELSSLCGTSTCEDLKRIIRWDTFKEKNN